jgi:hypothetical protein
MSLDDFIEFVSRTKNVTITTDDKGVKIGINLSTGPYFKYSWFSGEDFRLAFSKASKGLDKGIN